MAWFTASHVDDSDDKGYKMVHFLSFLLPLAINEHKTFVSLGVQVVGVGLHGELLDVEGSASISAIVIVG